VLRTTAKSAGAVSQREPAAIRQPVEIALVEFIFMFFLTLRYVNIPLAAPNPNGRGPTGCALDSA
jgi:hypothetical protein